MLLRNLGNGDLDDLTMTFAEKFICRVYNVADSESCNCCFLDFGHQKLFPRRVMQRDCMLEGLTSKQWYGNKPTWQTLPFHFQRLWAGRDWMTSSYPSWCLLLPYLKANGNGNDIALIQHIFYMDIFKSALQPFVGDLPDCLMAQFTIFFNLISRINRCPQNRMSDDRPQNRELHALLLTL